MQRINGYIWNRFKNLKSHFAPGCIRQDVGLFYYPLKFMTPSYLVIPGSIARHKDLSAPAKLVFGIIMSTADTVNGSEISNSDIADILLYQPHQIEVFIQELVKVKAVKVTHNIDANVIRKIYITCL